MGEWPKCPFCKKSCWVGIDNPDGCQCKLPGETTLTFQVNGRRFSAHTRATKGEYQQWNTGGNGELQVTAIMTRRIELYHFIRSLRFHLEVAETAMKECDEMLAQDHEEG